MLIEDPIRRLGWALKEAGLRGAVEYDAVAGGVVIIFDNDKKLGLSDHYIDGQPLSSLIRRLQLEYVNI